MAKSYVEKLMAIMEDKEFRSATINDLKTILGLKNKKEEKVLRENINVLIGEGKLVKVKGEKYNKPANVGLIKAKVIKGSKSYLFVKDEKKEEVFFIPPQNAKDALEGDRVYVSVKRNERVGEEEHRVAKVVSIIERVSDYLVGTYYLKPNGAIVNVTSKAGVRSFEVPVVEGVEEGKEVLLRSSYDEEKKWIFDRVLGDKNEPTTEILSILYKYGIESEFSNATLEEAEDIQEDIEEMERYTRQNLTDEKIITIDGDDAKDLDDAVQLYVNESGNYLLRVHIADVSYYVKQGSALDEEAFNRGTSVYLTDRVVPMLPRRLSNGICSLNPNVDRLVLSCEMEIDTKGNVLRYDLFESVINTTARMTYGEVNHIIDDNDNKVSEKYSNLVPMIKEMQNLSLLLRKKRFKQGSIDFEASEAKIKVDENNKPFDIQLRERFDAERLIEEFMLVANETVAAHFDKVGLPFIYRIHEEPTEEKLTVLTKFLQVVGVNEWLLDTYNGPKTIQKLLSNISDDALKRAVQNITLRTMNKAKYHEDNEGHYGLAKDNYTHFTSPIRRYPDLIVHRLIREMIIESNVTKKSRDYWTRKLPVIANQSSNKELKAVEAERELLEMKKAEFMEPFVGEKFEGVISNVLDYGLYVQLENTVQGLVPVESLEGHWEFFEEQFSLVNTVTNKGLKIGQVVNVFLVSSSKEDRKILFKLDYVSK